MDSDERDRQIKALTTRAAQVVRMQQELEALGKVFPLPDRFTATFRPSDKIDPYLSDELLRLVLRKGIGLLIEQLEVAIKVTLEGSKVIEEGLDDGKAAA